ncbi:DUF1788 domain-containing protein [Pseudohongiella sp.]|uniref:Cytoplasmic protein n=1 Tax=marine sediment metagenome TaxID=412755 RepID=A0A0F9WGL2_9ZZZZ|nr:DUF1788 domain-containing protein [Pseudohongiella sp.]HDZ09173.1 DUF1788 domain-containing protein [Pseudohongiella sp.]
MNSTLQDRLDQIPEKIVSDDFLQSKGLANDLGFWIFDYAPEDELQVRDYLQFLQDLLAKKHQHLSIAHIDLLSLLRDYLNSRRILDRSLQKQMSQGDAALLKALHGPLHMDKFAPYLVQHGQAEDKDIVLISGVGSVWPVLRAHSILNKLHALLGHKPLVLFYPGEYTGQNLSLFNRLPRNDYYRAFRLIP